MSCVGYSLKESWGEPRVVIGIGADEAAELAGTSGELPGQVTEPLASWPPGMPSAAGQPPAGV
ncbi:MAG: hypothetical protein ACRDOH_19025 [Streptosporangiaceae bacterium]